MKWSAYRQYEGSELPKGPSVVFLAFEKQSGNTGFGAEGARAKTQENQTSRSDSSLSDSSSQDVGQTGDVLGLSPRASLTERIKNLLNQGHVGKAVDMLSSTLYNGADVTPDVLDLSLEVSDYLATYMPHDRSQLDKLDNALQSYAHELEQYDFSALKRQIDQFRNSMTGFGILDRQDIEDLKTLAETVAQKEGDVEFFTSGQNEAEAFGEEFFEEDGDESSRPGLSEAQLTALDAAMRSLAQWANEQEALFERLKPKRVDWFEEQAQKALLQDRSPFSVGLTPAPRFAA